jgi:hypothetical protein
MTLECVERLRHVLKMCPDVKVVISSTWRRSFDTRAFKALFNAIDLPGDRIVGHTPMRGFSDGVRGHEIQLYLDEHPEVTGFVIVDDTNDMVHLTPHFVHTNFQYGLTDKDADDIITRFGAML